MKSKLYPTRDRYKMRDNSSDWEFKKATLLQQLDNGTVVETRKEGTLLVTLADKRTGEEKRGRVCIDNFKGQAVRLVCQSMRHHFTSGVSGKSLRNEYVSR